MKLTQSVAYINYHRLYTALPYIFYAQLHSLISKLGRGLVEDENKRLYKALAVISISLREADWPTSMVARSRDGEEHNYSSALFDVNIFKFYIKTL